jgi:hypothetical protein
VEFATFTTDLCDAIFVEYEDAGVFVVAVNDPQSHSTALRTCEFEITESDLSSYQAAADFLNASNAEVVCLQHEYGIFGGNPGEPCIHVLRRIASATASRNARGDNSACGSSRARFRSTSRLLIIGLPQQTLMGSVSTLATVWRSPLAHCLEVVLNLKRNSAPAWFPINPDQSLAFALLSSR